MNRPMELEIWKGDWGLSSIDLHCLEVMAYCKFSGVPLQVMVTNNPFRTPDGRLPLFKHGKQALSEFSCIANYLKNKNFSADFALTKSQRADVSAYRIYLKEKLYPALQYIWWVDQKNYIHFTRPWYASALPFPYNYYYPGRYERDAKKMIDTLYNNIDDPAVVETQVYLEAERCLTTLAIRLGESEFFFGSQPTSLDATLYAYLAPLLKAPFPSAALQNHLKACPNLVKFVVRVSMRYFPQISQDYETKRTNDQKSQKDSEADFPHRRRNQVFAGLFAAAAMTGYALSTGLVQIPDEWKVWCGNRRLTAYLRPLFLSKWGRMLDAVAQWQQRVKGMSRLD